MRFGAWYSYPDRADSRKQDTPPGDCTSAGWSDEAQHCCAAIGLGPSDGIDAWASAPLRHGSHRDPYQVVSCKQPGRPRGCTPIGREDINGRYLAALRSASTGWQRRRGMCRWSSPLELKLRQMDPLGSRSCDRTSSRGFTGCHQRPPRSAAELTSLPCEPAPMDIQKNR